MYSGSDLDSLMSALATLTTDGFFAYDFNVGQVNPYLSISVSPAQIVLFPALATLPLAAPLLNVFYSADFSAPVATFISNMQATIIAYVDGQAGRISAISAKVANWAGFASTYNSKG